MSVDQDNLPDITAINGASAATSFRHPVPEPIGAVVVGYVDGQLIINPTVEQAEKSLMHLVVAGPKCGHDGGGRL